MKKIIGKIKKYFIKEFEGFEDDLLNYRKCRIVMFVLMLLFIIDLAVSFILVCGFGMFIAFLLMEIILNFISNKIEEYKKKKKKN